MTDNTPPPQVWPTLRARDARGLIRFLADAFGFEETVVYGEGDHVHHAQLSWPPGGGIMLGRSATDTRGQLAGAARQLRRLRRHRRPRRPVRPGHRGRRRGIQGLHETDYGSRDFAVRDPEGNRWSFGTYRGEPRKA